MGTCTQWSKWATGSVWLTCDQNCKCEGYPAGGSCQLRSDRGRCSTEQGYFQKYFKRFTWSLLHVSYSLFFVIFDKCEKHINQHINTCAYPKEEKHCQKITTIFAKDGETYFSPCLKDVAIVEIKNSHTSDGIEFWKWCYFCVSII